MVVIAVVSIIILGVDLLLQFLHCADRQHAVFEGDGLIVVLPQQFHDLFLAAAFEGGLVDGHEAVPALVDLGASHVFLLGVAALVAGGPLAEEVVAVEHVVAPEEGGAHPDGAHAAHPPDVGLLHEVRVVKHQSIIVILST